MFQCFHRPQLYRGMVKTIPYIGTAGNRGTVLTLSPVLYSVLLIAPLSHGKAVPAPPAGEPWNGALIDERTTPSGEGQLRIPPHCARNSRPPCGSSGSGKERIPTSRARIVSGDSPPEWIPAPSTSATFYSFRFYSIYFSSLGIPNSKIQKFKAVSSPASPPDNCKSGPAESEEAVPPYSIKSRNFPG